VNAILFDKQRTFSMKSNLFLSIKRFVRPTNI